MGTDGPNIDFGGL